MDPFEPLGRLAHPFCLFGFAPTLFDAPSRDSRAPIVWTAHSFLAFIGEDGNRLKAPCIATTSASHPAVEATPLETSIRITGGAASAVGPE